MQGMKRRAFQRALGIARKHQGALAVAGIIPNEPSKPHLSLCLRVLSRRRTPAGRKPSASLSRCCPRHAVLLPESFRGGCSFGAGALADLSRRDCLEQIGGKHDDTKTVNAGSRVLKSFSVLQQVHDLAAQFLDTAARLV